jgi:ABC-type polysaccharide/polyol phosphate transport system ATPase subunit
MCCSSFLKKTSDFLVFQIAVSAVVLLQMFFRIVSDNFIMRFLNGRTFSFIKAGQQTYAGVTALDKINFESTPGDSFLAGENGSGKSTMIKIISGTVKADSGSVIEINGAPIQSMNAMDASTAVSRSLSGPFLLS